MEKATFDDEQAIFVGTFVKTAKGEFGMVDSIFIDGAVTGYGFVTSDESSWTEKIIPFNDVTICDDASGDDVYMAYTAAENYYKNEIECLRWRLRHGQSKRAEQRLAECMAFFDYLHPHIVPNMDDAIRRTEAYESACEKLNSIQ